MLLDLGLLKIVLLVGMWPSEYDDENEGDYGPLDRNDEPIMTANSLFIDPDDLEELWPQ